MKNSWLKFWENLEKELRMISKQCWDYARKNKDYYGIMIGYESWKIKIYNSRVYDNIMT